MVEAGREPPANLLAPRNCLSAGAKWFIVPPDPLFWPISLPFRSAAANCFCCVLFLLPYLSLLVVVLLIDPGSRSSTSSQKATTFTSLFIVSSFLPCFWLRRRHFIPRCISSEAEPATANRHCLQGRQERERARDKVLPAPYRPLPASSKSQVQGLNRAKEAFHHRRHTLIERENRREGDTSRFCAPPSPSFSKIPHFPSRFQPPPPSS